MDTGHASPADENGSNRTAQNKRLVTTRRVLIGGAPLIMSLASKPALAWPQCSISRVLSGDMSHDASINPTETCAMSPGCWSSANSWDVTKLGAPYSNGHVSSGGCSPSDKFGTLFGIPNTKPSGSTKTWYVSSSKNSLLDALKGNVALSYCDGSNHFYTLSTSKFGSYTFCAQVACAVLNACAFYVDGHFLDKDGSDNIPPSTIFETYVLPCFNTSQSTINGNGKTNSYFTTCGNFCNGTLANIGAPCLSNDPGF